MKNDYQSYFGKNTKVFIFKCSKCGFEDPVPIWILSECGAFPLFGKKVPKKSFKMTCPKCGKDSMTCKIDSN